MEQEISFVTSFDGTRLGCASAGIGPPMVKAPNWLSHLTADWEGPVWSHWWRELTIFHRLIRFDQRGCGLSDRAVADLSFEAWVRDLESVVEAMGLTRFPLFGMSQGAAVAVEFAVRNPEKVSCLILYGGIARGWAKSGHPPEANEALATLIRSGWESDNPAFRQVFTSQFMPDATKDQMDSFNELSRISTSAQNAVRFQYEVGQVDIISSLAQVRCPTIVCHCRHDARVPFAEGLRELAAGQIGLDGDLIRPGRLNWALQELSQREPIPTGQRERRYMRLQKAISTNWPSVRHAERLSIDRGSRALRFRRRGACIRGVPGVIPAHTAHPLRARAESG